MDYPWYSVVDGKEKLQQGDFIFKLPVYFAAVPESGEDDDNPPADTYILDSIVLSQSCDLENKKVKTVLVCPFRLYTEFVKENSYYGKEEAKKALDEGTVIRYHLLNKCDTKEFNHDYMIVDFGNTFSVPFDFLDIYAKKSEKRLRLLPPYREQLAQSFARCFMRVGSPTPLGFYREKPACAVKQKV